MGDDAGVVGRLFGALHLVRGKRVRADGLGLLLWRRVLWGRAVERRLRGRPGV